MELVLDPRLFIVHCGFYDSGVMEGIYEFHVNFLIVASDVVTARAKAKEEPEFQAKRMHVDGLQEVCSVNGYRLSFQVDESLAGATKLISHLHRDLAPKREGVKG